MITVANRRASTAVALAILPLLFVPVLPLDAHHSPIMFDTTKAVTISGTIVRFEQTNPHSYLYVQLDTAEGPVDWAVEGPGPNALVRRGIGPDLLSPGDAVEACGYALKPNPDDSTVAPRRLLVAEVVQMPDGEARLWSPYGNHLCRDQHNYTLSDN